MILNRIGTAIRNQDWFVVILEVFVVVFGVFIGLQVDDWNKERQERKQEQVVLERLLEEAENAVAYITGFNGNRAKANEEQERLVAFVSDPNQYLMDEEEATGVLLTFAFYPAMVPARNGLDELTASGNLQLIRSQKVRDALGLYEASLKFHDSQLQIFRTGSLEAFMAPVEYYFSEYDPGNRTGRKVTVDWQALREDNAAVFLIIDNLRNQRVFQFYREGVLRDAQQMCEALAEELGRECAPLMAKDRVEGNS